MLTLRPSLLALLAVLLAPALVPAGAAAPAEVAAPKLDVPYEPTHPEIVKAMLDLGGVKAGDVVYDLGCGDGRIVIAAAKRGARAIGVDLDPRRIREAKENARKAGVEDKVELRVGDLFETDVRDADVVMLYLWPEVNLRLRPRLLEQLKPGARVVSHSHDMGDWKPDRVLRVRGHPVHVWTIPDAPLR